MVMVDAANELMKIDRTKPYEFKINGQKQSVQLNEPTSYSVFNDSEYLIVNDQDFEKYAKLVPDEEKTKYYGYYIEDWKSTEDLVLDLKRKLHQKSKGN